MKNLIHGLSGTTQVTVDNGIGLPGFGFREQGLENFCMARFARILGLLQNGWPHHILSIILHAAYKCLKQIFNFRGLSLLILCNCLCQSVWFNKIDWRGIVNHTRILSQWYLYLYFYVSKKTMKCNFGDYLFLPKSICSFALWLQNVVLSLLRKIWW